MQSLKYLFGSVQKSLQIPELKNKKRTFHVIAEYFLTLNIGFASWEASFTSFTSEIVLLKQ